MKIFLSLLMAMITFLSVNAFIPSKEECEIYESTVRLHVIANSDSAKDQEVKLKVRDAVLEKISEANCKSRDEAVRYIEENKEKIKNIALQVLKSENSTDGVEIFIGNENYPTRDYENFSLPAGSYLSVRIVIGNGEGRNWWCVLFPPLCTQGAVFPDENEYVSAGLTSDQYKLITGNTEKYKVKFKLLEIASEAFGFDY